jgi:GNAT superfamily N-acetyltransferase
LKTWGELYIDKRSGDYYLHQTVNGYVAIMQKPYKSLIDPRNIAGIGYIYKLWDKCKSNGFACANVSIVVKKKFQGQGIGSQFHVLLEQLAKSQRIGKFYASQDPNNDVALHLVQKRGWTVKRQKNRNIVEKYL